MLPVIFEYLVGHLMHHPAEGKISLMIAGAQKSGTTSLKNYLGQHPALATHPHKEFGYFYNSKEYKEGYNSAFEKYFSQAGENVRLIAKNAGLYMNEGGIHLLTEHSPNCKIVLILRNPVERTYSSFLMEKNYGSITGDFDMVKEIALRADRTDWRYEFFIGMSTYSESIEMIRKYVPKDSVRFILYEEFSDNPENTCRELFEWLGVDPNFMPDTSVRHNETRMNRSRRVGGFISRLLHNQNPVKKLARKLLPGQLDYKVGEVLRNANKSQKKYDPMCAEMEKFLYDFYKPHNEELARLTGLDLSSWIK
jgi:Sulfotransferase domain